MYNNGYDHQFSGRNSSEIVFYVRLKDPTRITCARYMTLYIYCVDPVYWGPPFVQGSIAAACLQRRHRSDDVLLGVGAGPTHSDWYGRIMTHLTVNEDGVV